MRQQGVLASLLVFIAAGAWSGVAQADSVSPGAQEFSEGNLNNTFPFDFGATTAIQSMHYQQVYGASDFTGPILITGIAFRPDGSFIIGGVVGTGDGTAFGPTAIPVVMRLSTTSSAVDGLNPIFAANFGADVTAVVVGNVVLSSAYTGPALGPKDFDIIITFSTPFYYDPSAGNLLLDILMPIAPVTTGFDAHYDVTDTISRLWAEDSAAAIGLNADSFGLVTKFISRPVPEPAIVILMLGAGIALARRVRRTRSS